MLTVLKETLLYIEQQHDWLAYIQSVIGENEEKYKLLHSQTTFHISEELNKHELRCDNEQAPVKQKQYEGDFETGTILNVLQQNVLYIEQRHNWLVYIQSDFDEKKQECKLLHAKISCKITEELNKNGLTKLVNNDEVIVVNREESGCEVEHCGNRAEADNVIEDSNQQYNLPQFTDISNIPINQINAAKLQNSYEVPQKCLYCSKSFRQKQNLTDHLQMHINERLLNCKVCSKTFTRSNSLKAHELIHIREKPFECSYCSKRFKTKQILIRHERIHTGEKTFKCAICSNSFRDKFSLKQHVRVHTSEKPYKCTNCGKSFNQKYSLTCHLRLHTGEKPYKCFNCCNTFRMKTQLIHHKCIRSGVKPLNDSVPKVSTV